MVIRQLAALGLTTAALMVPAQAKTFVYVSAAEDGDIYRYELQAGAFKPLGKTEAGKLVMPMATSPNGRLLYAAVRSQPFRVLTYAIDPATGGLSPLASAPLPDSMPYIATDRAGRYVLTASYGGDKVAVNPADADGGVRQAAAQVIATGRNAHSILADASNRFVYATNLGSDQVLQFRFDAATGALTPNDPPLVKVRPGHGPRHIAFSPDGRFVYVLSELSGAVIQFAVDRERGTLTDIDYVGTVPADSGLVPGVARPPTVVGGPTVAEGDDGRPKIWAADLAITPDGRFMYTTERTKSHIALLSIAADTGKLTYVTNFPTEEQPRGIRLDRQGKVLIATGEKSDQISAYHVGQDGMLTLAGRAAVGRDANWVEIVEVP